MKSASKRPARARLRKRCGRSSRSGSLTTVAAPRLSMNCVAVSSAFRRSLPVTSSIPSSATIITSQIAARSTATELNLATVASACSALLRAFRWTVLPFRRTFSSSTTFSCFELTAVNNPSISIWPISLRIPRFELNSNPSRSACPNMSLNRRSTRRMTFLVTTTRDSALSSRGSGRSCRGSTSSEGSSIGSAGGAAPGSLGGGSGSSSARRLRPPPCRLHPVRLQ